MPEESELYGCGATGRRERLTYRAGTPTHYGSSVSIAGSAARLLNLLQYRNSGVLIQRRAHPTIRYRALAVRRTVAKTGDGGSDARYCRAGAQAR